jgi:hypothetical protein
MLAKLLARITHCVQPPGTTSPARLPATLAHSKTGGFYSRNCALHILVSVVRVTTQAAKFFFNLRPEKRLRRRTALTMRRYYSAQRVNKPKPPVTVLEIERGLFAGRGTKKRWIFC